MGGTCSTHGCIHNLNLNTWKGGIIRKNYALYWENNIKNDFIEEECEDVDWIPVAQDRFQWHTLVGTVMNLWVT
jgi:hypothetical protein